MEESRDQEKKITEAPEKEQGGNTGGVVDRKSLVGLLVIGVILVLGGIFATSRRGAVQTSQSPTPTPEATVSATPSATPEAEASPDKSSPKPTSSPSPTVTPVPAVPASPPY